MPKALEQKLTQEAASKHLQGKAAKAYIFGTMNRVEKGAQKSKPQVKPAFGGPRYLPIDRGGNQDGQP